MPDPEPEAAYYGGGAGFAQPQADAAPAPEYPQAPLPYGKGQLSHFTTAKRSRRRFKWLLCVLAALFALTLLASGVFSYLDRVERSAKPPAILKNE